MKKQRIYKKIICKECSIEFEIEESKRTINRQFCGKSCSNRYNKRGKKYSEEINKKKGRSGELNAFYNKKHSEETKKIIGKKNSGKYEEKYGEEKALIVKKKLREAWSGDRNIAKKPEIRKKISIALSNKPRPHTSGDKNGMFGKGEKIKGEKNGSWKGGISFGDYGEDFNEQLKTTVRTRDKFVCAECNKNGYDVHHIDYNKKNNNINNLITLCRSCHAKTNFNREEFEHKYKKIIIEKYGK